LRNCAGNPDLGVADMQNISMDTLQAIYGAGDWNRMRCDGCRPVSI
jgi:hypothetical protein